MSVVLTNHIEQIQLIVRLAVSMNANTLILNIHIHIYQYFIIHLTLLELINIRLLHCNL